ncbi:alpha/beta-hydrolase [Microthyrium microscopicum]|uniref:Carboxylic ester hydrolase n=1 Tax=Microthyrium microscopicum TaxID=703497 RepID=A0A6A6U452_9PEZI|nr:alpha/beta-hydrolase [Microthyrium microscopicum]
MKLLKSITLVSIAGLAAADWSVGQKVTTTSGEVVGHAAKLDSSVSEYLGLPFAQPPVGKLRWMPPVRTEKSSKPIIAAQFGPDCSQVGAARNSSMTETQKGVLSGLSSSREQSEDCLTLNIWTKPQSGEKKKAVLVWVYGGGFSTGSTATPSYNGVRFAGNQDVVLVSINYRLMIMGFPAAPEIFPDVNLGLLDQRVALEWVRDNIAAFGGDPARITLFGESAGGRSVDIYSYAWADEKDPIVNGFIAESGSAPQNTGWLPRPKSWFELSSRLGCGGEEKGKQTVDCMRGKSLQDVMAGVGTNGKTRRDISRAFTPVVDGKRYFADYDKRSAEGKFIQKPMLTGSNDNESGLQSYVAALSGTIYDEAQKKSVTLGYTCGAKVVADRRAEKKLPIWRYRWMTDIPSQRLTNASAAWHGSEISSVFNLVDTVKHRGSDAIPAQIALSKYMNNAWAEFAKDPEKGLDKLGLPHWNAQDQQLILFGSARNLSGVAVVKGDEFDKECSTLKNTLPGGSDS